MHGDLPWTEVKRRGSNYLKAVQPHAESGREELIDRS